MLWFAIKNHLIASYVTAALWMMATGHFEIRAVWGAPLITPLVLIMLPLQLAAGPWLELEDSEADWGWSLLWLVPYLVVLSMVLLVRFSKWATSDVIETTSKHEETIRGSPEQP